MNLVQPPAVFGESFKLFRVALEMQPDIDWRQVGVGSGRLQGLDAVRRQGDEYVAAPRNSSPKPSAVSANNAGPAPRTVGPEAQRKLDFFTENVSSSQYDSQRLWNSLVSDNPNEKILSAALDGVNEALRCIDELVRTDPANASVYEGLLTEDVLSVAIDILCQIYRFDLAKLPLGIKGLLAELNARLGQFSNNRKFSIGTKHEIALFIQAQVAPVLLKTHAYVASMQSLRNENWLAKFYNCVGEIHATALSVSLFGRQLSVKDVDTNSLIVLTMQAVQKHMTALFQLIELVKQAPSNFAEDVLVIDVIAMTVNTAFLFGMDSTLNILNARLATLHRGRGAKQAAIRDMLDSALDMDEALEDVAVELSSLGIKSPYGTEED